MDEPIEQHNIGSMCHKLNNPCSRAKCPQIPLIFHQGDQGPAENGADEEYAEPHPEGEPVEADFVYDCLGCAEQADLYGELVVVREVEQDQACLSSYFCHLLD